VDEALATVPARPLADTTETVVTVPPPAPVVAQVPSAFKNLEAAASHAAGAGTKPFVPPAPESPTIAIKSAVT